MKKLLLFVFSFFVLSVVVQAQKKFEPTTIILVRHTEKETNGGNDPKLTKAGETRAAELARMIENVPLVAVYSTDFKRTKATAKPTASSKKLKVKTYDPSNHPKFLAKTLKKHKGKAVLIVGHSNTVPVMANILLKNVESVAMLDDKAYDDIFIITIAGKGKASVLRLKYGAKSE